MKKTLLFVSLALCFSASAQNISQENLSKHVHYLASPELQGRALGTEGKDKAAEYILHHFEEANLKPFLEDYVQEFDLNIRLAWVKAKNIIGMIEGSDPKLKDEYIVLGAHYDHLGLTKNKEKYYPGADDNASGVATILELAKYFNLEVNKPKRSIIFIAFDAEESGLLGSNHFVKQLDESQRKQIKAMFSFDMVGMLSKNKGLDLKGIGSIKDGKELAMQYATDINILNVSKNIEARTDTEPFGDKGIPAIHVFTGLKSPYHKPEDQANLLDYEGMEKVATYSSKIITELGNQTEINPIASMEYRQNYPKKVFNPFKIGVVGYFGSGSHLYKDEFYDAKSKVSASIGLRLQYKFAQSLAITAEGLYDQQGSSSAQGRYYSDGIMVPVNIQYGKNGYFFAGAYFKHHLNGKDGDVKLDFDNTYRQQEWGYNLGFGLQYSKYHLNFTVRNSFQSIFREGPNVKPQGAYVSLGYNFW